MGVTYARMRVCARERAHSRCRVVETPLRGNLNEHGQLPAMEGTILGHKGQKCGIEGKKVAERFGVLGEKSYLCRKNGMTRHQDTFVITGINRLSGQREELSGPMEHDQAELRLERYKENTKWQRMPTYTRLRIERRLPIQLTIQFNQNQ